MQDRFLVLFGEEVKKQRKAKDLSQEKLAFEIGMDLTSVNEIENGHRNPTLSTVVKIAQALGLKVKDLIPF